MIKKTLLFITVLLVLIVVVGWLVGGGLFASRPAMNIPVDQPREVPAAGGTEKQLLFGDLHVHTSFSMDAAFFGTPAVKGTGYYTPADACDFARYCSALDFWSINDHAEAIAPWQWQATQEAVRQCNAITEPSNPDTVAFLGWEWSQGAMAGGAHYGHKNVLLLDTAADQVPARPIASDRYSVWRVLGITPAPLRGLGILSASRAGGLDAYSSVTDHLKSVAESPECPAGPVRELPEDCYEYAQTPTELYAKLDDWGFEAIVIPHGLAWGTTNPVGADFADQLVEHNAKYQRLVEIYSGHGNSEVYRGLPLASVDEDGVANCPQPAEGYTPCCWQAGNIVAERCQTAGGENCSELASLARNRYVLADNGSPISAARGVIPDAHPDDWGSCDQLPDAFQPAHNYQPRQSAQYILTLGNRHNGLRPGFIGSSDNHTARPGSSYKEFARYYMTDTKDTGATIPASRPENYQPRDPKDISILEGLTMASNKDAYYFTGGLVAVHSEDRSREAIWSALQRREVYGTSGPRIELWFDLLGADSDRHPMGSEVWSVPNPRFVVRARGSRKQLPGCPGFNEQALGPERLERLCRGECFNPSDQRHAITRLEIVRVLSRLPNDETTAELIEDPWRVIDCAPNTDSCEAEFSDDSFGSLGREAIYYVRAIQEPTDTIQGDPSGCEYDDNGNCIKTRHCIGADPAENCLSPAEHRAWSSPIYVMFAGE